MGEYVPGLEGVVAAETEISEVDGQGGRLIYRGGYLIQDLQELSYEEVGYLRGKDFDRMVDDLEGFARRQPALFLGGAFMLGLLAARFLKSGNPRGYGSGDGSFGRDGSRVHRNASISKPVSVLTPLPSSTVPVVWSITTGASLLMSAVAVCGA